MAAIRDPLAAEGRTAGQPLQPRLFACITEVPDPELAPARRTIAPDSRSFEPWTGHFALGAFDGNALELALQVRDRYSGTLAAISVGGRESQSALRKAVAATADEAVWLAQETDRLDAGGVARILAAAIQTHGSADLVLCGRQGGEWGSGQVGPVLARELGMESISFVRRVRELSANHIVVEREVERGLQAYECALPCVLVVTNDEANQLRGAKVRDTIRASRTEIAPIEPAETAGGSRHPTVLLHELRSIDAVPRTTTHITGTPEEQVSKLADIIESTLRLRAQ